MSVGSSSNGWRGNGEHIWKDGSGVSVIVGVLVEVGDGEGDNVTEGVGSDVLILRAVGLSGKSTWATACGCGAQPTNPIISNNPSMLLRRIIVLIISGFHHITQAGLPEKLYRAIILTTRGVAQPG
jgi:hypothetical protein